MKYQAIILLLLLVSCKKEITVRVQVKDKVTANGIPNSHVRIIEKTNKSTGASTIYNEFFDGYTDSNGELVITKYFNTNYSYQMYASTQSSSNCYTNEISKSLFTVAYENEEVVFEYAECAKLKLSIHNVNCLNSMDSIFYKRFWVSGNTNPIGVSQLGCFQYDGNYFNVPYGEYRYEWDVTKNGNTIHYDTTFYLDIGDSAIVTMNY